METKKEKKNGIIEEYKPDRIPKLEEKGIELTVCLRCKKLGYSLRSLERFDTDKDGFYKVRYTHPKGKIIQRDAQTNEIIKTIPFNEETHTVGKSIGMDKAFGMSIDELEAISPALVTHSQSIPTPRTYLTLDVAKKYVRSKGITSKDQWQEYVRSKGDLFPLNIPKRLDEHYKISWSKFFEPPALVTQTPTTSIIKQKEKKKEKKKKGLTLLSTKKDKPTRKEYLAVMDNCITHVASGVDLFNQVQDMGKQLGYTEPQIGKDFNVRAKALQISQRTIQRILPPAYKGKPRGSTTPENIILKAKQKEISANLAQNQAQDQDLKPSMPDEQQSKIDEVKNIEVPKSESEVKVQTQTQTESITTKEEDTDQIARQKAAYNDGIRWRPLNEEQTALYKQEIKRREQIINKINWDLKNPILNHIRVIESSKFTEEEHRIILLEAIRRLMVINRDLEDYKKRDGDYFKQLKEVSKRFKICGNCYMHKGTIKFRGDLVCDGCHKRMMEVNIKSNAQVNTAMANFLERKAQEQKDQK